MSQSRYPLVAYTDASLTRKVRAIQQELHSITGARASLDLWEPHISVGSEVWLDEDQLDNYVQALRKATAGISPFEVEIKNFGFMDNWAGGKLSGNTPYVVFLDVVVNPHLQHLAEAVRPVTDQQTAYYTRPWPYQPHLTVAFKDLTREGYDKAKQHLAQVHFAERTRIDSFSVVRHVEATGKNVEARRIVLGE